MNQLTKNAYAKINLALDVLRKRPDGYHEVRMVMQTVGLYDKVTLKKTSQGTITLHTNLPFLPVNENNLVYRAIDLFRREYGITDGIDATLEKHIPVAAGLAGGSSDAACALRGMNELFEIGAPLQKLQELGVMLGADIPYCLLGGTALSEGIGEKLTPLPAAPACSCLIVKPSFNLSTRYVYEHLVLNETTQHPRIDDMLAAIEQQNVSLLSASVGNVLESVSIELHPEIADIKRALLEQGAVCSLMSGSGPSVFGLFTSKKAADKALAYFKNSKYGRQVFLTGF